MPLGESDIWFEEIWQEVLGQGVWEVGGGSGWLEI